MNLGPFNYNDLDGDLSLGDIVMVMVYNNCKCGQASTDAVTDNSDFTACCDVTNNGDEDFVL
ncbi:MAG: hypothetical protein R2771_09165 [Saprospiraceae bacterium]